MLQKLESTHKWAYRLWKLPDAMHSKTIVSQSFTTAALSAPPPPPPPNHRVVITGIGLVTPLGVGSARVWDRLLNGETAVRALTEEDLPEGHRAAFNQLPSKVIACVPRKELEQSPCFTKEDSRRTPQFVSLALTAAAEVKNQDGPCMLGTISKATA